MKPIAVFVLVAAFSLSLVAASAKTVNAPQGDNDRIASTTAGQGAVVNGATTARPTDTGTAQPSKKALKKSKIQQKPKLQDPN
jgi:hypothetical protein